jgi:hypothetical protein
MHLQELTTACQQTAIVQDSQTIDGVLVPNQVPFKAIILASFGRHKKHWWL